MTVVFTVSFLENNMADGIDGMIWRREQMSWLRHLNHQTAILSLSIGKPLVCPSLDMEEGESYQVRFPDTDTEFN